MSDTMFLARDKTRVLRGCGACGDGSGGSSGERGVFGDGSGGKGLPR